MDSTVYPLDSRLQLRPNSQVVSQIVTQPSKVEAATRTMTNFVALLSKGTAAKLRGKAKYGMDAKGTPSTTHGRAHPVFIRA
jgi:hypothetical protein